MSAQTIPNIDCLDVDDIDEAIQSLEPVVRRQAAYWSSRLGIRYDDAYSAGLEAAWRSAQTFDGRGQLMGYASKIIALRIIDFARSEYKRPACVSLDYAMDGDRRIEFHELVGEIQPVDAAARYGELRERLMMGLSRRDVALFSLRYDFGLSLSEIGNRLGMCQANACRLINILSRHLRSKIKQLGL